MRLCVISVKPGGEKNIPFEATLRQDQEMIGIQRFIEFEKSLVNPRNSPSGYKIDNPDRPNRSQVLSDIKTRYDKKYPNVRLDKYIYESASKEKPKKIELPQADPKNPKEFKLYCAEVAKKLGMVTWMTPKKGKYDDTKSRVYNPNNRSMSMSINENKEQKQRGSSPARTSSFRPSPLASRVHSRKNSDNKVYSEYSPLVKKGYDKKSTVSSDTEPKLNDSGVKIPIPRDIGNDEKLKFQYFYQHYRPSDGNVKDLDDEAYKQRHESLPSIKETKESPRNSVVRTIEKRGDKNTPHRHQTEGNLTEKSPERIESKIDRLNNFANKMHKEKIADQKDVNHLFKRIFKNYDNLEKKLHKNGNITYNFEDFLHKSFSKNNQEEEVLVLRDLSPFKMELEQLITRENEKARDSITSKVFIK